MSFATLSGTLAECSAISTLEITKNPFDSEMEGRLNLPALSSPSIFTTQKTPSSEKKGFRWSIDQISKLDPADIDEFPNQEYSSTYERPEDETKAQEAINEYFSHGTILPSPWTPENHVKHVTFSPLPPSTAYISGDEDSMTDVSHNSSNSAARRPLTEVSCQTSLTFHPSFDLTTLVDSGYYSYVEEESTSNENKKLNVSSQSLRRKLFSQDDSNSPVKPEREKLSPKQAVTRSILKSPSPKTLLTSSPYKERRCSNLHADLDSPFSTSNKTTPSPQISPIKSSTSARTRAFSLQDEFSIQHDATISNDDVFTSNILESSDVRINPDLIPDVSPIKDPGNGEDEVNKAVKNKLDDGGPMKMSELSDVSMDCENSQNSEGSGTSDSKMDMAELEPLSQSKDVGEFKVPHIMDPVNGDIVDQGAIGNIKHDVIIHRNDDDLIFDRDDDVILNKGYDDVILRGNHDDIILRSGDDDIILRAGDDDVISKCRDDVIWNDCDGIILDNDVVARNDVSAGGNRVSRKSLCPAYVETEGQQRERRTSRDNWESGKENMFAGEIAQVLKQPSCIHDDGGADEAALVKRASAAMRRADRLVREARLDQGTDIKRSGTSAPYLNWSRVDGTSLWHPIDMSTPVVHHGHDNLKKPLTVTSTDAAGASYGLRDHQPLTSDSTDTAGAPSGLHHHQFSDLDSYTNLLNSFANSHLDRGPPRSYSSSGVSVNGAGGLDSGVGATCSPTENYSKSRGLESRRRRSAADVRTYGSLSSPREAYLSGRYDYTGSHGKRFSWPPWKSARTRYTSGRCISPTMPSGAPRHRSADDARMRRLENFGKISRPLKRTEKYVDYFDGMHSNCRKTYCR